MLNCYDTLIPVFDKPMPEFVEFIAILLKDVQKITSPEQSMTCHDQHENQDQDINKI